MTKEEKELLLRDLCARLPYGVKAVVIEEGEYKYKKGIIESIGTPFEPLVPPHDDVLLHFFDKNSILGNPKTDVICFSTYEIKPFLRPMESMTKDEHEEYQIYVDCLTDTGISFLNDWLLAHHFDYRGLIERGLAIEAPEGMYE
ncbi:MAG: hypothetical protein J6X18_06865 [Bacteroidales bacterium]|nr:hypothetical protein [Bacteroidales bacterium]